MTIVADILLRARVLFCVFLLILGKCATIMIPVMYKNIINALPARVPVMSLVGYGLLRYFRSDRQFAEMPLRLAGNNLSDLRSAIFVEVENYATREVRPSSSSTLMKADSTSRSR